MNRVQPYTMDELESVIWEWEHGGKPRFESDRLRAGVTLLDMAVEMHDRACDERDDARTALAAMTRERDAARAEVERLMKECEKVESKSDERGRRAAWLEKRLGGLTQELDEARAALAGVKG